MVGLASSRAFSARKAICSARILSCSSRICLTSCSNASMSLCRLRSASVCAALVFGSFAVCLPFRTGVSEGLETLSWVGLSLAPLRVEGAVLDICQEGNERMKLRLKARWGKFRKGV